MRQTRAIEPNDKPTARNFLYNMYPVRIKKNIVSNNSSILYNIKVI